MKIIILFFLAHTLYSQEQTKTETQAEIRNSKKWILSVSPLSHKFPTQDFLPISVQYNLTKNVSFNGKFLYKDSDTGVLFPTPIQTLLISQSLTFNFRQYVMKKIL